MYENEDIKPIKELVLKSIMLCSGGMLLEDIEYNIRNAKSITQKTRNAITDLEIISLIDKIKELGKVKFSTGRRFANAAGGTSIKKEYFIFLKDKENAKSRKKL